MLRQARLAQYRVSGMPGLNLAIDGKPHVRHWREPNIMIALAGSLKAASGLTQEANQFRCEATAHSDAYRLRDGEAAG